jgi:hypothetical protein
MKENTAEMKKIWNRKSYDESERNFFVSLMIDDVVEVVGRR